MAPVKDAYIEKITSDMTAVDVTNEVEKITTWLQPRMVTLCDTKMRITAVDGALQLYGHQKEAMHTIRNMRDHFKQRYDSEDHPEDLKVIWSVGEVCIAKLGDYWYRARILEVSNGQREVAVIYVDLGNVRTIDTSDLRIPRDFAYQPALAIRMVLESIIPPNDDKFFPDSTIKAIQEEIGYWNTGFVKVTSTRMVSAFPIPVNLCLVQKKGGSKEQKDLGQILLECGLSDKGYVNILDPRYNLHARVNN